jgi:hypothetical protein
MIAEAWSAAVTPLGDKGTFFEYARMMLASRMIGQLGVLMAAGVLGVCANYVYKWLTEQIAGSLWTYLFTEYPRRTMLSFSVYLGWAFTAISTGLVSDAMPWGAVINLGLTTGFAIDALVNKARRAQWTDEERQAKAPPPAP